MTERAGLDGRAVYFIGPLLAEIGLNLSRTLQRPGDLR